MAKKAPIPNPQPVPQGSPQTHWATYSAFISLLLVAATLIAYYPAFHNGFVSYDDPDYITDNAHVKGGLNSADVAWAFRTAHAGNWHPLTWISHMLDVQLFKLNPAGHHAVNILFHTLDSVLLFFLLRRLTKTLWQSAFVAALFALHPVHVESVAWISERKDVLSAFFFFLTLLAYSRHVEVATVPSSGTKRSSRSVPYIAALVLFALGLMSKPMLVTLPFVLLLIDYWPLNRFQPKTAKSLLIEKIPFFALSAASCLVTLLVQKEAEQSLSTLPLSARFGNTLISYVRYLGKMFWPVNLATPYPHPGRWPLIEVLLAGVLLVLLTVIALRTWRKFPFVPVGWLWFLGMLVPVIGIVQVGEQSMADRYTYLPLIGLFIVLVWGVSELCVRLHIPQTAGAVLGCLLLIACAARARDQVRYWEGSESLYRHAVAVTRDNFIAYYNLGSYLDSKGHVDAAMTNYVKALEIQPHYQDPLNNIGVIYAGRKQFADAVPYFEAALRSKPDFTDAHNNLANALRELRRFNEAIPHFKAVVEKKPNDTGALNNLGNALVAQGQFAEAVPYYEASLRVKPDQAAAHYDLGNAFLKLHRLDDAIPQYRAAVEENPNQAQAHNDLGIALAMRGNTDEAIIQLREALRLQPGNVNSLVSLGKVYGGRRQFDQALPLFTEAVRLAPDDPDAHGGLGTTLASAGKLDEAIVEFQTSLRLRPGSHLAHFNLGRALAAKGRLDEARDQYNEALQIKPDFAPAQKELNALGPSKAQ